MRDSRLEYRRCATIHPEQLLERSVARTWLEAIHAESKSIPLPRYKPVMYQAHLKSSQNATLFPHSSAHMHLAIGGRVRG